MFPEQETVRHPDARPAVSHTARNGALHAKAPAEADRLQLRVSFAREGEYHQENSRLFPLTANRWERLEIPLPADWQGGGLRMQPQCRFGLLEIVGVRVVSSVMGESLWEMLGRDLLGGVRVSAGMQVLSNQLRLRLLCTGDDAQIVLPDLALPSAEVPLVLELGLRVRTDLASIGYTLHEWVDDANTRLRAALGESAAAETARAYNEEWAKSLLTEVEMARADGDRREAALREQLAEAHEAARALAATLAARAHGEERAGTPISEQASALDHDNGPASALVRTINGVRRQIERDRQQMLALRERTAILQKEAAQQHGEVQRLEQTLSFSHQQKANIQAELVEARRLVEEHRGRVLSMRRSFSWRLTLPLRIVGRTLTGRRPASRKGAA